MSPQPRRSSGSTPAPASAAAAAVVAAALACAPTVARGEPAVQLESLMVCDADTVQECDTPGRVQEVLSQGMDVRAFCDFCLTVDRALIGLATLRPGDARLVRRLGQVKDAFEAFLRVEGCTANAGVKFCGTSADLHVVFNRWMNGPWDGTDWQQRIFSVDPAARREATLVYAWWLVFKTWHSECRNDEPRLFEPSCLGHGFHAALSAAKVLFDWGLARKVFDLIMVLPEEGRPDWLHLHKTYMYHSPKLPQSPAVWSSSDSGPLGQLARHLEASAEAVLREWVAFRALPAAESEARPVHPSLRWNASSWLHWKFFEGASGWSASLCSRVPSLCRALQGGGGFGGHRCPAAAARFEEVAVSELPPGAHVGVHSGAPFRVNLHMGLTGTTPSSYMGVVTEGSETEYFHWRAGKVTAIFDDSYDHFVRVDPDALEPRAVLHVGVCHPALTDWYAAQGETDL